MSRLSKGLMLGLLTGAVGLVIGVLPFGLHLEESLGLPVLFTLRGATRAPPDVVVVSIDKASADALDLPVDVAKWPRALHARLTNALAKAGAAVIVFDIFFEQSRSPEDDQALADSIGRAGNVVLAKRLSRETVPLGGQAARPGQVNIERLVAPLPLLGSAAVTSAPFPLPKVPVRVDQYWTFKTSAGDTPTLPVAAFQVFALDAYDDFLRLLEEVNPVQAGRLPRDKRALIASSQIDQVLNRLRALFKSEPDTAAGMLRVLRDTAAQSADPTRQRLLHALIRMYQSPDSQYLNFFGPVRTITTIPYHRVLELSDGPTADGGQLVLRGKAVFVGVSDHLRLEQKDGFHTVFSGATGVDLSGVEIAATAFANLLEDRPVRPIGLFGHVAVFLLVGMAGSLLCSLLSPVRAGAAALAVGLVYFIAAQDRFNAASAWYPLTVPLLLQVPGSFVGALLWRYADANRERETIRKAFSYYLPDKAIEALVRNVSGIGSSSQLVYGICLSTDAERYTTLAESLDPRELAGFMNDYYAVVFGPIRRHGGIVSDVIGDAALAIWTAATPERALRRQACDAAADIAQAVEQFNRSAGALQLPTRIGLHSGHMMLGNVGAMDHYEYRAVGDIVNTATRIQGLNKRLGTRILVSGEVLEGLDGLLTRKLGTFLLAGKSKPLVIHELVCRAEDATEPERARCALFAEALSAYEKAAWDEAGSGFAELVRRYGADGPSLLYLRRCQEYSERPPEGVWDGVIRIEAK